jgi:hypothetical protein
MSALANDDHGTPAIDVQVTPMRAFRFISGKRVRFDPFYSFGASSSMFIAVTGHRTIAGGQMTPLPTGKWSR